MEALAANATFGDDDAEKLDAAQKLWLEVGWLVLGLTFVGGSWIIIINWPWAVEPAGFRQHGDAALYLHSTYMGRLAAFWYKVIWSAPGSGWMSVAFQVATISVSLVNFACFSVETEMRVADPETQVPFHEWVVGSRADILQFCDVVEVASLCFFIVVALLRLNAVSGHPWHGYFGHGAWWRYLKASTFMQIELLCLLPSCVNVFRGQKWLPNFMWLSLLRTIEFMQNDRSSGAVFKRMKKLAESDGPIFKLFFAFGCVLWVLFSGLYFLANKDNDDSRWDAVEYEGEGWQRFESVPSSMFYVLINLSKENPLAEVHKTVLSRVLVMGVCLFGVPLFGLPAGILGSALQRNVEQHMAETNQLDDDEEDDQYTVSYHFERYPWILPTLTGVLSAGCAIAYFYYTAGKSRLFGLFIDVDTATFAVIDGVVAVIFLVEWAFRVGRCRRGYFCSMNHAIDFLAWLPGLIHASIVALALANGNGGCVMVRCADAVSPEELSTCGCIDWLRAFCVLRMLKLERYAEAFRDMWRILYKEGSILKATGFLTFIMWIVFSTLLYYTERHSPDDDLRENYGSIPRALWAEAINLHGEWPWADYSPAGKGIGAVIALFSTGIFMVPIAIFSNGYTSRLEQDANNDVSGIQPWQAKSSPPASGLRSSVYNVLYAHLFDTEVHKQVAKVGPRAHTAYRTMRRISLILTCLSAGATVVLTIEKLSVDHCRRDSACQALSLGLHCVDVSCVLFFAVEIGLRLIALGPLYCFSFVGICDLVSLTALSSSLLPAVRASALRPELWAKNCSIFSDMLVPARLMRLFCFENYLHPMHLLMSVSWLKRKALLRSGYALVTVWFLFGSILHLFERDPVKAAADDAAEAAARAAGEDLPDVTFPQRFRDVLTSLQYALVHLTGDYPITDYHLRSRLVHIVTIVFGTCFVAAFTGIFVAGFVERLKHGRSIERRCVAQRNLTCLVFAALAIQRKFRRMRARREAIANGRTGPQPAAAAARERDERQGMRLRSALRSVFKRETAEGKRIMTVTHSALFLNVLFAMVATVPEVEAHTNLMTLFDAVEIVTGYIFVNEYIVRLCVSPRPFEEARKPMRVLDLICLLPVLGVLFQTSTAYRWRGKANWWDHVVDFARVLRVLRILDFTSMRGAGKKAWRAFRAALGCLAEPAVLALSVWVVSTSLFAWAEHEYDGRDKNNMKTMPDALYWTSIYIIGEWANVDFSVGAGSRLCIFYCLFGVATFAVPVGLMMEAVESTLVAYTEEHKELQRLLKSSSSNSVGERSSWGRVSWFPIGRKS